MIAAKPSSIRRVALRGLRIALIVYLGIVLLISYMQEWLIFPGHSTQGQRHAIVPNSLPDARLERLKTSIGDDIVILVGTAQNADRSARSDAATRPTIVFFYGNAMCLADAVGFLQSWQRMGANVVGVEFPGYGMSGGQPGEAAFYAAGEAVYEFISSHEKFDKSKLIPTGLSIGTGVAVELAFRHPTGGLALFAPYTSLDDLARAALPWLPTRAMLRHHFRNIEKIGSIDCPILIAHGRHDSIIPHEMSEELAAAATRSRRVTTHFVNSDHNDLFEGPREELDAAMQALIEEVAASK